MNVLAIGAHPDDLEINCFGTLAKCVARGDNVGVCVVSNGNLGHEIISKEELGAMRIGEAAKAAALIGADFYALDIDDLHVKGNDDKAAKEMARVIRAFAPDLIITHNQEDYHSDHKETFRLVFRASFAASVGHFDSECESPPVAPAPIYQMDNFAGVGFAPTEYVDVGKYIDLKLTALACHSSQTEWMKAHDDVDLLELVDICTRFRGIQCGVRYAEGFRPLVGYARMTSERLLP